MQHFLNAYKNYAKFDGRATRTEYWMYCLFFYVAIFALFILGTATDSDSFFTLIVLFVVGSVIPTLAITVRRLHDTGRSGAAIFWSCVPFVGGIIHLVQMCDESQKDENRFGPNPFTVNVKPAKDWEAI